MVKWWTTSRLRFYWLNAQWNYRFWLHAQPIYKERSFNTSKETIDMDSALYGIDEKIPMQKKKISTRRFVGFMFEGRIYQDNPGLQGISSEVWDAWIKKGLV